MKKKTEENINEFRIGDIGMHSSSISMSELVELSKSILKDRTFRNYLEIKKSQRIAIGSYFG